ncbi:MAG: CHAD domain-containing protein [Desulfuromonadales bacterium]|nr:CHAD domain-containing protein [Desulfuromonadales bacterium]
MIGLKASTQLWLGAWGLLQDRSDEFFRLLTRDCQRLDLESIHDLRVSSRRLREGLSLFSPCFPKRHLTPLRSRLKKLTDTLGAIRNTDEALHFFAQLTLELDIPVNVAAGQLVFALQAQRNEERAALKKNLKALNPAELSRLFTTTCHNPIIFNNKNIDPLQPIADFLKTAITKRETPLRDLYPLACDPGNITAQHQLRITLKRFRYRMEYCSALATPGYNDLYTQVKSFHDLLGQLHDLDVFSAMVVQTVSYPTAQQAMQDLIAQKRKVLFAEFLRQDAICPVISLGERLRRLL